MQDVIEGVFQWMDPGQLLVLMHHNYYGFLAFQEILIALQSLAGL